MRRQPVSSSSIAAIGYRPDTALLEVAFCSGSIYQYLGVSPHAHAAFLDAPSKGLHFNTFIKNDYAYRRVCAEENGAFLSQE